MRYAISTVLLLVSALPALMACPSSSPATSPPSVPVASTSTLVAAPGADAGVVPDDCSRGNAAEDKARVEVPKVSRHSIERDAKARTITERFEFDGYGVTTSEGGCTHAGHTITVQGPGLTKDKAGLAALLARLPMTGTERFQAALKSPDTCDQPRAETEVLRCSEASIEVTWGHNSATLSYDFAL